MRRKFSIDLPKLKLPNKTASTAQPRVHSDGTAAGPDSPTTPVPKSLVALPTDLDAALRRACTLVVDQHRASADLHDFICDATKPALDYATIKGGLDAMLSGDSAIPDAGAKYSYKPNVPIEELFRKEDQAALLRRQSQKLQAQRLAMGARADQSAAREATSRSITRTHTDEAPQQRSMTVITHTDSPPLSPSGSGEELSKQLSRQSAPAIDERARPESKTPGQRRRSQAHQILPLHPLQSNPPARSDSSASDDSQAASADEDEEPNQWHTSTGKTSAVLTPAKGPMSKRASDLHAAYMDSEAHDPSARKPVVGGSRRASHQTKDSSRPGTRLDVEAVASEKQPEPHQNPDTSRPNPRNRDQYPPRSDSRLARDAHAGVQDAPAEPPLRRPSTSLSQHVREYFRPGSTSVSRKPSMDISRSASHASRRGRSDSVNSVDHDGSHLAPDSASGKSRWRPWRSSTSKQYPTPDYSRPSSATGWFGRTRSRSGTAESVASVESEAAAAPQPDRSEPQRKPMLNLNRELPPLPGLDQWRPEWDENSSGNWGSGKAKKDDAQTTALPQVTPESQKTSRQRNGGEYEDLSLGRTLDASMLQKSHSQRERQYDLQRSSSKQQRGGRDTRQQSSIAHQQGQPAGRTHVASASVGAPVSMYSASQSTSRQHSTKPSPQPLRHLFLSTTLQPHHNAGPSISPLSQNPPSPGMVERGPDTGSSTSADYYTPPIVSPLDNPSSSPRWTTHHQHPQAYSPVRTVHSRAGSAGAERALYVERQQDVEALPSPFRLHSAGSSVILFGGSSTSSLAPQQLKASTDSAHVPTYNPQSYNPRWAASAAASQIHLMQANQRSGDSGKQYTHRAQQAAYMPPRPETSPPEKPARRKWWMPKDREHRDRERASATRSGSMSALRALAA